MARPDPEAVDLHVGTRIFCFRRLAGLTQAQLAERVGVRFQQIQKYECGLNRVSVSRLWLIAQALDRAPGEFFDGLAERARRAA